MNEHTIINNHVKSASIISDFEPEQRLYYNEDGLLMEAERLDSISISYMRYSYDSMHNISMIESDVTSTDWMRYINKYENNKLIETMYLDSSGVILYEYNIKGLLANRYFYLICKEPKITGIDLLFSSGHSSLLINPYDDVLEEYYYDRKGRIINKRTYFLEQCADTIAPQIVSNKIYKYKRRKCLMHDDLMYKDVSAHETEFNSIGLKVNETYFKEETDYEDRYLYIYDNNNLLTEVIYEVYDLIENTSEIKQYKIKYELYIDMD
ncbi:MAG: hypothetical protein H7Y00_09040 [Fimbriimonadaceae bacterium]|nr:hypothetical protein [Chitinophagales bacterium]